MRRLAFLSFKEISYEEDSQLLRSRQAGKT